MNIRATSLVGTTIIVGLLIAGGLLLFQERQSSTEIDALHKTIKSLGKEFVSIKEQLQKIVPQSPMKSAIVIALPKGSLLLEKTECKQSAPCEPDTIAGQVCSRINYRSGFAVETSQDGPRQTPNRIVCFD